MKKIGVLGGTFNPVHNTHLYIASEAKRLLKLQEVIFIPAGNPPHKDSKGITEAVIRGEMTKLAIRDYKNFTLSEYEINKKSCSYTYETLQYLKNQCNDTELFFITGADSLINLDKWKNVPEILSMATLVVFRRPGYTLEEIINKKKAVEEQYNCKIILLELMEMDISSTDIRNRIKNNEEYRFFVPEAVYSFIETLKLYR